MKNLDPANVYEVQFVPLDLAQTLKIWPFPLRDQMVALARESFGKT